MNACARALALAVTLVFVGGAASKEQDPWTTTGLGEPFDDWRPTVQKLSEGSPILTLEFDSPALGFRARSLVILPDGHDGKDPVPAVYYLHGTRNFNGPIFSHTPSALWKELGLDQVGLGDPFDPVSSIGNEGRGYAETRDRQTFAVIVADAGEVGWCASCFWVDGTAVKAETHVVRELVPLAERVFRLRTDRGGRGLMGYSMGGVATLFQGLRHPDLFSVLTMLSGWFDVRAELLATGGWRYMDYQGYGPPAVDEIRYRAINPMDLTSNLVGVTTEVLALVSDGCAATALEPDCQGRNRADAAALRSDLIEIMLRENIDRSEARMVEAGVPLTVVRRIGTHGQNNGETFRTHFMPRMNALFASGAPLPARVSYKSIERSFDAWGYTVEVERENTEFLHLLGARTDGRDVTLAGTGTVALTTPAAFTPGRTYAIRVTRAGEEAVPGTAIAGENGRLRIDGIELGDSRTVDEREALVESGQFRFPQTRVEIID